MEYLLNHSNLPGPRGNLELLYDFSRHAREDIIVNCLNCIREDTANSPEEFAGMCGILGYAVLNSGNKESVISFIRKYASHSSWRIRESVAMAIQEVSVSGLEKTIENLKPMIDGNQFDQRAVVAGLCEPKLLKNEKLNNKILKIMVKLTKVLDHDNRLDDSEESLRKALGYGWSVVIAASPENGKRNFETLFDLQGKHIRWIMKENLKKNRLVRMDKSWVDACNMRLLHAST
jgi:hypothetical protein